MNQGYNIQITPELYSQHVYELHQEEINQVFRHYFGIEDTDFITTYHETYKDANKR